MSLAEFDQFFKTLAKRFRNETDLSDLTYTAIEVIPGFKKDFIRYFFSDLDMDGDIEVARERRKSERGQASQADADQIARTGS